MIAVFGIPLLFSMYLSTRGWTPTGELLGGNFVGIDNYVYLLTDPTFMASVWRTVLYTLITVSAEMTLGLAVASMLNKEAPGMRVVRSLMLIPMIMTPVVATLCWRLMLDPEYGIINQVIGQKIMWVSEPNLALLSVSVVNIWQNVPYVAILLLAAMRGLSSDPVEAARIDGATRWQTFWHITLPALRPAILVAMLLRTIFEFRAFDNIYVLTGGGPGGATNVMSMFTYGVTFQQFDSTFGATSSWIMLAVSLLLCSVPIVVFRLLGHRD